MQMGQLTWQHALAHLDQMYKLAEEELFCGNGAAVVFVYDELQRNSVANRAGWNDRSLDLAVVFGSCSRQANCPPVWVVIPRVRIRSSCECKRQGKSKEEEAERIDLQAS